MSAGRGKTPTAPAPAPIRVGAARAGLPRSRYGIGAATSAVIRAADRASDALGVLPVHTGQDLEVITLAVRDDQADAVLEALSTVLDVHRPA